MSEVPSATTLRLAVRRLFAAYLFLSGLALAFPHRPTSWLPLATLHVIGIVMLLELGPYKVLSTWARRHWPRLLRVLGDWYALALVPALYTELAVLNVSTFNGRYFDPVILGWEGAVFGGQPSRELVQWLPFLPLSELLHLSYISYYLIIYLPPLYLYLKGREAAQQQVVFTLMLAFFAHYLFFIYFPVQGPRYLFAAPGGEISRGFFYTLAHRILETGSSRGAAFPSSHVGVAFAQAALQFTLMPRAAPLILLAATGLALGAVYGGFHYAIDAVCGMVLGLLMYVVAARVIRRLGVNSE